MLPSRLLPPLCLLAAGVLGATASPSPTPTPVPSSLVDPALLPPQDPGQHPVDTAALPSFELPSFPTDEAAPLGTLIRSSATTWESEAVANAPASSAVQAANSASPTASSEPTPQAASLPAMALPEATPVTASTGALVTAATVASPASSTAAPRDLLAYDQGVIQSLGVQSGIFNPGGTGRAVERDYRQALHFEGGGTYYFDFVANPHGAELLTDMLSTPHLEICASADNRFTIVLGSYDSRGRLTSFSSGLFDTTQAQQWTLVCTDSISGFSSEFFTLDTRNFLVDLQGGRFFLSQEDDQLVLNFTPVPEPSTWILMGGAFFGSLMAAWRRRRRS